MPQYSVPILTNLPSVQLLVVSSFNKPQFISQENDANSNGNYNNCSYSLLSQFLLHEGNDLIAVSLALIRLLHLHSNITKTQITSSQVSALTNQCQTRNIVSYVPYNISSCSKITNDNIILTQLSEIEEQGNVICNDHNSLNGNTSNSIVKIDVKDSNSNTSNSIVELDVKDSNGNTSNSIVEFDIKVSKDYSNKHNGYIEAVDILLSLELSLSTKADLISMQVFEKYCNISRIFTTLKITELGLMVTAADNESSIQNLFNYTLNMLKEI